MPRGTDDEDPQSRSRRGNPGRPGRGGDAPRRPGPAGSGSAASGRDRPSRSGKPPAASGGRRDDRSGRDRPSRSSKPPAASGGRRDDRPGRPPRPGGASGSGRTGASGDRSPSRGGGSRGRDGADRGSGGRRGSDAGATRGRGASATGRDRPSRPGSGRDTDRSGDERGVRPPRPPVKGRRRTFDIDSAPTPAEQERLSRGAEPEAREQWIDEGPLRKAADDAVHRAQAPTGNTRRRAERAAKRAEAVLEIDPRRLRNQIGTARADRTMLRLGEASAAYAEDRFEQARNILKGVVELVPTEPSIRELYGLTLYRLGRWKLAVAELEEFHRLSRSTEQHPVLADCYRALGRHARVAELWSELGEESLAAPLVAEGRIVYAGSLADQGKVAEAIALLEAGALGSPPLKDHHLRMRYVLADLYDRAGDHQAARRFFESIVRADPAYFDVRERLAQL